MASEEPIGPRKLEVGRLTDEDFQELCHRLVRIEYPEARSVAIPDGGADTLLPRPTGGWERAWNPKRYTGNIHWSKCKESLGRAVKTYGIARMTFCFARNLTSGQQLQFQKQLVGRHPGVAVDYWDEGEILARLHESEAGQRVAKHYFGDPAHDNELMLRTIRAGGTVDTAGKVIERAAAIGEFLGGHDPFFSYPAYQFEEGMPTPPLAPGAVMAIGRTEGGSTVRLDAVPRDEDALSKYAPRLRMEFDPSEEGKRAAETIDKAIRQRRAVTVDEGLQITAEQLPPLFGDMIGKPTRGTVVVTPTPTPPWGAVFHAVSDRGDETFRVRLDPTPEPPAGSQVAFRGERNGLIATIKARWVEGRGGQIGIDWSHRIDDSPAREQLRVLKFLEALHGNGEVTITDDLSGRPELKHPLKARHFGLEQLVAFFEDVVVIEDWMGQDIRLPESADVAETTWVAEIAAAIRRRALKMRWDGSSFAADPKELAHMAPRSAIRIEHDLRMNLLGQNINLGHGVFDVPVAEVHDRGPIEGNFSLHRIEILPAGGEPQTSEWGLLPPES
jgi:hypothetical protein